MLKRIFDLIGYNNAQFRQIYLCPINRDGTRREYDLDDHGLFQNPKLLEKHWFENGGATEFAKKREEFYKEVEVPDEPKINGETGDKSNETNGVATKKSNKINGIIVDEPIDSWQI